MNILYEKNSLVHYYFPIVNIIDNGEVAMDMMEQILHGIVFLLLFLQHVIRLLQMEKEMDMVQKMGIPVVLVIGTQNKFNFIQMMEQSLLII